ncbi:hypothetical protein ASF60_00065 [Methylobacterium sp. Leaf113]|uniref:AAA family ATPase n=1 Tax=Methylobacterium sp. Leaf113 TaxID=1736259 RepID=UPI0006FFD3D8|nr:AAA family ATPase [Methylobacterium sp. Leaf113]KQP94658.1 hypothetical protein ASF60_00065 [Methylobacterium sp. Leaf113]
MLHVKGSSASYLDADQDAGNEAFSWLPSAFAFLRRSRVIVAVSASFLLALAILYLFIATPKYDATADILIDLRQAELFRQQNTATDAQVLNAIVESQTEILRSNTAALGAIRQLGPSVDKELNEKGLLQSLLGPVMGLMGSGPPLTQEQLELAAAEKLMTLYSVRRVGITNIIEVSVRTPNAARSARYANAIADAFIADQLEAKYETTRRGRGWLEGRLAELRDQATAADRAVQDYKAKMNIVDTDKGLMSERQVGDLNGSLIVAQAKTAEAKARLDRITDIVDKNITDGSMTDLTQNQVIVRLRQQYFDTARREADISAKYGTNHVAAVNARAEMAELQRSLRSEFNRLAEAYRSDYEVALSGEAAIKKRLDGLVADAGTSNRSRVELRSLESSSQTYRSLYENFLQKYTQAVQDQSFPISEARVVSPARPPLRKSWPKGLVIIGLALVGGVGLGLMIALFRELVRSSLRTPSAVEQVTGLACVAMIPRVETFKTLKDIVPRALAALGLRPPLVSRSMLVDAVINPRSGTAAAMQEVKMLLDRPSSRAGNGGRVIGMISAISGEGKTMVASNLAHYLAHSGKRVLLLDYDLRSPSMSQALAPEAETGLLESINTGRLQGLVTLQARGTKLHMLPTIADPQLDHASEILRSPNNVALLNALRSSYDFIIVDYPPALDFPDVRATDELIDEYLMVVGYDRPSRRDLAECILRDRFDTTRVLGIVFNRTDPNRHTKQRSRIGRYMPWNSEGGSRYVGNTTASS